jgi:endonuclease-8
VPEGDTVWRAARQLHEALAGRALTRSDFRVPRFATTDLTGRLVLESVARGKHLMLRVDGGITVHTHLSMEGSWRVRPAAATFPGSYRIRLILANETWQAIGYQLGSVDVLRTAQEDQVTGHLGPDLLGPDWDPEEAVRRLGARPDRPVGEALLDQRNLAGVGNVYKSEILFLRGIHPRRPVAGIAEPAALVDLARRLLDANKDRVSRVTTGVPRPGQETWVYGRGGRPCRRCGTLIKKEPRGAHLDERVTYWCPHCQS